MSNQQSVDKNKRREEARAKALEIKKEQERRERRSRMVILAAVIAGLALVVALAVIILRQAPSAIPSDITSMPADVEAPANASTDDGSFALYQGEVVTELPADVPVLDLYLDFMCSHCANFETIHNDWLMGKQESGELVVRLHPIAILGASESYVRGSTYAALLEKDLDKAQQFASWAFINQTATGMGATAQADYLKSIGVSDQDAEAATSGKYERFIQAASTVTLNTPELRDEEGGFGTPAIFFDGDRVTSSYIEAEAWQADVEERIVAATN